MGSEKTTGIVVKKDGNYYLEISGLAKMRKKDLISLEKVMDKETLERNTGKTVSVFLSEPMRHVVGLATAEDEIKKMRRILCYIPLPFPLSANQIRISPEQTGVILESMVREGYISGETAEELKGVKAQETNVNATGF